MAYEPSGTVTFVFADIDEEYFHVETDRDRRDAALRQYDSLFREAMQANGGYVYQKAGNAFQVAFSTAVQAVAAAAQAQRAFQSDSATGAIKVRMALHTGVTDIREGSYVGPLLNRVSRVMAAAHGGQVLLTQATEELVRDDLPHGV